MEEGGGRRVEERVVGQSNNVSIRKVVINNDIMEEALLLRSALTLIPSESTRSTSSPCPIVAVSSHLTRKVT